MAEVDITPFTNNLQSSECEVSKRYQSIFELKNVNTPQAIKALVDSYEQCRESVLLSHQILYALGQLEEKSLPILRELLVKIVETPEENNLARHEAAEALANYFLPELKELYEKHLKSQCNELRWTCQIALQKVLHPELKKNYGTKYYGTKEPAAPFSNQEFQAFLLKNNLQETFATSGYLGILLEKVPLFEKYRVMYLMRDQNTPQIRRTLCRLLSKEYFKTQTSLLKHQICFILGQIGCDPCQNLVRECIENNEQEFIVRHQALAAVASQSKDAQYLDKFTNHPNQLLRESAQVAQFMIKYWND